MNKEELIKFLKENLEIELNLKTDGWNNTEDLEITLILDDEIISETSCRL